MPPAARITDNHTCPKVDPPPHVGGPVSSGASKVIIGFQPAARVGDRAVCVPGPDTISKGERTVIIEGKDAARQGDPTAHGGKVVSGCPTVLIGSDSYCLKQAAASAAAFLEGEK
ncbi:MAG: PAAR domain-containing protein [Polyangiaceae bacterium]